MYRKSRGFRGNRKSRRNYSKRRTNQIRVNLQRGGIRL